MKGFNTFHFYLIHIGIFFLFNITPSCFAYDCSVLESAWDTRTRLYQNYWENEKYKKDRNIARKIKLLIENNDQIYRNYIKDAFFKNGFKYCHINDPMVKLINNFSMATREIITYDELSKNMLMEKSGTDVVWSFDEIVWKDPVFLTTWLEKYRLIPTFYLISALFNSLSTDSENTIKYLVALFQDSDGMSGEYFFQQVFDLFQNNPQTVLYFTPQFEVVEERLKSVFREYISKQQRQVLIDIYKQFKSNTEAKRILEWLGEGEF